MVEAVTVKQVKLLETKEYPLRVTIETGYDLMKLTGKFQNLRIQIDIFPVGQDYIYLDGRKQRRCSIDVK